MEPLRNDDKHKNTHLYLIKTTSNAQVIDICGPTPKGTGLQNMREAIIESKWKYDVSPEDKQVL